MIERYFPNINATQYGIVVLLMWMSAAAIGDLVVRVVFDVTIPVPIVLADSVLLVAVAWYHEHITGQQPLPEADDVRVAA